MESLERICKECGNGFVKTSYMRSKHFCSVKCENAYNYKHYTKAKREKIKENRQAIRLAMHTKICNYCGKDFYKKSGLDNALNFCCSECQYNYRFENGGRALRKYKCKNCGIEFERMGVPHGYAYCSISCSNANKQRKKAILEDSISGKIKPDYRVVNTYVTGNQAYKQILDLVLTRDNHSCFFCGSSETRLHAHHIVPIIENISQARNPENLVILCTSCHSKLHVLLRKQKKFSLNQEKY